MSEPLDVDETDEVRLAHYRTTTPGKSPEAHPLSREETDDRSSSPNSAPTHTKETTDGTELVIDVPTIILDELSEKETSSASPSPTALEYPNQARSTDEDSASFRARSQGSAAESIASTSTAVRAAQRNYLSPLRSKRYDALRSSLSSSAPTRPGGFSAHSRSSSIASFKQLSELIDDNIADDSDETIKWAKLRKITSQLYSESGRRAFGQPTCMAVAGVLAIGTSKGFLMIFDYQQVCRHILGSGTEAISSGPVASISLSADHTCVAAGHEDGSIYSWDLTKTTSPARIIHPITLGTDDRKGHAKGTAISFISFVGARHSAFVSADAVGMVFYHSFNRRILFSSVESIRILGRYPESADQMTLKPSTTYASTILPFGNVSDFTDEIGLVAVLTPYKLALISTLPVPRTQFSLSRSSGDLATASAFSGCAAWFPAMKEVDEHDQRRHKVTRPVLAFAWCRHVQFLEVHEGADSDADSVQTSFVRLEIRNTSDFVCSESIVALQWYSRSILCMITSSSQLLLLNTSVMKLSGRCDLLTKHIVHHDLIGNRLQYYFEAREAEYVDQRFADLYSHSFQLYKGKTFLLGTHDFYVGSLHTWADRLLALISAGQHIQAIELLCNYYSGTTELTGLRLPYLAVERKAKLSSKIYETMLSSVRFSLSAEDLSIRADHYHTRLIDACLRACLLLEDVGFFLNDIYNEYEEVDRVEPFLDRLSISILDDEISKVPPSVVQDLVRHFMREGLQTRLEDLICHLDPMVLDINEIVGLCKHNSLYNALTYVYNEALQDFKTPLLSFFRLIQEILRITQHVDIQPNDMEMQRLGSHTVNAVKIFPYISLSLTGRIFPSAKHRSTKSADAGRIQILEVLFSADSRIWSENSSNDTMTGMAYDNFPYLRLLLQFDCPTLFASMDEAFEDPFLNESIEISERSSSYTRSVTRQFIVNILLEIMSTDFEPEDVIYLYMFIARNVPKYPQFILLSGTLLHKIILGLCDFTDNELAEDCQLSVEYLLSIYKPADPTAMLEHYRAAGFYRVLKTLYRSEENWSELLLAELRDEASEQSVFDCLTELLGPDSSLSISQKRAVQQIVLDQIVAITSLNGSRAAELIERYVPELQESIFKALSTRDGLLYIYLKQIMSTAHTAPWITAPVREKYIDLLCVYDRSTLLQYLQTLRAGEVDMSVVVTTLSQYDYVDAIIELMSVQGNRAAALAKVITEMHKTLKVAAVDSEETLSQISSKRETLEKYALIGAGLCESETGQNCFSSGNEMFRDDNRSQSPAHELMWVDLMSAVVSAYTRFIQSLSQQSHLKTSKILQLQARSRNVVQAVCSRLFLATFSRSQELTINVLRGWFLRLKTHSQDQNMISVMLEDVFGSYKYYHQLLGLAQAVLGGRLFSKFADAVVLRNKGWKVVPSVCCICEQSLGDVKHSYNIHRQRVALLRLSRQQEKQAAIERRHGIISQISGKRPMNGHNNLLISSHDLNDGLEDGDVAGTSVISHACAHISHETCYQKLHQNEELHGLQCPRCRVGSLYDMLPKPPETAVEEHLVPSRY